MTKATDFIKRRSLLVYFTLTFIISWGAVLILAGPNGIPVAADQAVALGMALLLGPSVAGILLTGLTSGRDGLHRLLAHLLRWRVSARWYAVAFFAAPLSTVVVLLVLSLFSPAFTPSILISDEKASLILTGFVAGLMVGIFEELGWTGFATPKMRLRYSVFTTGLIVGLMWGAWHFIMFWENDSFSGALPLAILLAGLFAWLPAYRILMVWVYDRTESLFVVILMHASLVATMIITEPPLIGEDLLTSKRECLPLRRPFQRPLPGH
ncbi:MAG: CPBP family intramembrane metalloprotease [Anaerolineae bacterium]|nr:CPBP family intramembrane metalloprotease [Anaerolineae bacterium]